MADALPGEVDEGALPVVGLGAVQGHIAPGPYLLHRALDDRDGEGVGWRQGHVDRHRILVHGPGPVVVHHRQGEHVIALVTGGERQGGGVLAGEGQRRVASAVPHVLDDAAIVVAGGGAVQGHQVAHVLVDGRGAPDLGHGRHVDAGREDGDVDLVLDGPVAPVVLHRQREVVDAGQHGGAGRLHGVRVGHRQGQMTGAGPVPCDDRSVGVVRGGAVQLDQLVHANGEVHRSDGHREHVGRQFHRHDDGVHF